jgi:hypothetical protein
VGKATASLKVKGRAFEVERLWYDTHRWPSWVDGFGHLVKVEGDWPERGARVIWDSPPGGRGRVQERVVAYEARTGMTVEVEDAKLTGRQTVAFEPGLEETGVTLTIEYEIKERTPLTPIVDLLFVRRSMGESLRRTLERFSVERASEIQFG